MRYLRNRFFAGFLILLPSVVTGWVIFKIVSTVDSILDPVKQRFPVIDVPGIGFATVLLIILITGIFAGNFVGRRIIRFGEEMLYKLPVVRRIYMVVKDLSGVLMSDRKMVFRDVVLIEYPLAGSYAMAFVTEDSPARFREKTGVAMLNVFVPTTPNPTSGFLLFVPENRTHRLPLTVEEALKMVISGGVLVPGHLRETAAAESPPAA